MYNTVTIAALSSVDVALEGAYRVARNRAILPVATAEQEADIGGVLLAADDADYPTLTVANDDGVAAEKGNVAFAKALISAIKTDSDYNPETKTTLKGYVDVLQATIDDSESVIAAVEGRAKLDRFLNERRRHSGPG